MKKILFVCNLFAPANHISSIRPTKIAKYMSKHNDVTITVIANEASKSEMVDPLLEQDLAKSNIEVIYTSGGRISRWLESFISKYVTRQTVSQENKESVVAEPSEKPTNYNTIKKKVLYILRRIMDYDHARYVYKQIKKSCVKYDTVVTFGTNYVDYVGKFLKKKGVRWIADFRDPFFNYTVPAIFKRYAFNYGTRVVGTADHVIAVSPGYMNSLKIPSTMPNTVLTNGFDPDDIADIEATKRDSSKFTFACVGNLYEGKRDIAPVMKALRELCEEGKVQEKDLKFLYAGVSEHQLVATANKYGLGDCVESLGKVARTTSIDLQLSSDILLLPSWNDFDGEGIIPGKFLEFMMMKKPIVAIISGKGQNCFVSQIIKELALGCSFEQISGEVSYFHLKDYLEEAYTQWKATGYIRYRPDEARICAYSYPNIAERFLELIHGI